MKVEIFSRTIHCLLDTGASMSVLNPKIFDSLPEHCKTKLQPYENNLKMADGHNVRPLGTVKLPLLIDNQYIYQIFVIADIDIPIVLGYDFMYNNQCVIDVPNKNILLNSQTVDCHLESQIPSLFKISIDEQVTIPPNSETIIHALPNEKLPYGTTMILDNTSQSFKNKGVLVAKSICTFKGDNLPLRVMNLTDLPQTIYKNTCAGTAETICSENILGNINAEPELVLPEHMQVVMEKCKSNLKTDQCKIVVDLLTKYSGAFAMSKNDLGRTDIIQHKINTGNAHPIKQNPRRVPLAQRKEVDEEIQRMLDGGIIRHSQSPWSSPIVVVRKKDQSIRLCIDFRLVNDLSIKDNFPLPRIEDCLDALRGNQWFSTLDLASGYHQVGMDPQDGAKTAFVTSKGLFEFNRMPFGLCNAGATFSRLMQYILSGLQWEICVVYLDDIIVFSKSFEEHITRLQEVFDRIQLAGLKIAPKKCFIFQKKVSFLGHVVNSDGISPDPIKIEAVQSWPIPANVKDVRSFLGTCSYYRKFIKDFSKIARPLHRLTEKNVIFKWNAECETAFIILKEALITSPILTYPCIDKEFILDTDASGTGVGAVLSQINDEGKECVIAYFSRTLSKTERQYCVTRRELLAIVLAVKHFHHYLYGVKFTVRTDHGALNWLKNFKNPEGQLARWLEILGTYTFIIKHRAGLKHGNADGLSRRPCVNCKHCDTRDVTEVSFQIENPTIRAINMLDENEIEETPIVTNWFNNKTPDEFKQAQLDDPIISQILTWKKSPEKPKWPEISHLSQHHKTYWSQWERLTVVEGILYRKWENTTTNDINLQYVLPCADRNRVLLLLHNDQLGGHLGFKRTIARIRHRFYWAGYTSFVERWCKRCTECQKRNQPSHHTRGQMKSYIVGEPMERVSLDILGPVTRTYKGNKYVIVVTDYFTRYAEAYGVPDIEAQTVADKLLEEFICRYGLPLQIHTDQGSQFTSDLFMQMCKKLNIDKTRNSPFHPQSSGLVERLNRTIEDMISKFVTKHQKDWDQYLPYLMMAYRSSVHETLGETPCFMMMGREVRLPVDLIYGGACGINLNKYSVTNYVDKLSYKIEKVHEEVRDRLVSASERQKRRYDLSCTFPTFKVGDGVLLHDPRKYKGRSPKFQMRWSGPFTVIKVLSDVLYKIQEGPKVKFKVVHVNRLKPFQGNMKRWYQPVGEPAQNTRFQVRNKLDREQTDHD